jgi:hypothetical protein
VSSLLEVGCAAAGLFSVALGVVHLWIPRIFAFERAIGRDDTITPGTAALGSIQFGRLAYVRSRSDAIGLTWVMSNAASYVLITIGIIDLAWAFGDRTIPSAVGAVWIAGWWGLRAAGQFGLGRRIGDVLIAVGFAALATLHLVVAFGSGPA